MPSDKKTASTASNKRQTNPLPKDPAERFKAVVNRRGANVIKQIRSLGKIANQRGQTEGKYDYSNEDVAALCERLRNEIDEMGKKLGAVKEKAVAEEITIF